MSIFSITSGLSTGLSHAINKGLLQLATPELGLMQQLMDGQPKVLVTTWNGDATRKDGIDNSFDAERGDGVLQLLRPTDPAYQVPVNFRTGDPDWNIRAAVPLWVLGRREDGRSLTLAIGAVHPVFTAATLDFYCPSHPCQVQRIYFADPRMNLDELADDDVPLIDQWDWIEDAGGTLPPGSRRAPRFHGRPIA